MRGLAGELEADPHDPEQVHVPDPLIEAVHHHRRVHVLEDPALDKLYLAAAALFRRRAHDVDAALRQPVADRGQPLARPGAGRRDRVVTAGMTDRRQRVVLAQDRDRRTVTGLDGRAKCGVDAGHAALDLESLSGQEVTEPARRLDLLKAKLGIVVDAARERFEIVAKAVDRRGDRVFEGGHLNSPGSAESLCSTAVNYITQRRVLGLARGHRRTAWGRETGSGNV